MAIIVAIVVVFVGCCASGGFQLGKMRAPKIRASIQAPMLHELTERHLAAFLEAGGDAGGDAVDE